MCVDWVIDIEEGAELSSVAQSSLPGFESESESVRWTPEGPFPSPASEPRSELSRLPRFYAEALLVAQGGSSCEERLVRLVSLFRVSVFALLGELESAHEELARALECLERVHSPLVGSEGEYFDSE